MKVTVTNNYLDQLDKLAWKATCEWSSMSDTNIRGNCDDYAELSRWFLWDKVGRAIRFSSGLQSVVFEKELIKDATISPVIPSGASFSYPKKLRHQLNRLFSLFNNRPEEQTTQASSFQRRAGPLVYVPVLSDRLKNSADEMIRKNICQVAFRYALQPIEGAELFQTPIESHPDHDTAASVYFSIIDGLKGFGVNLLAGDATTLRAQIINLTAQAKSVQAELEILRPDAILMHGDNHPPFQVYILAARKMGIPTIMLQHGLDCEHRYLDEAYASAIAVWGPERLHRYREKSTLQPNISVTGNPEYDHLRAPVRIDTSGDYWLWVTRPHTPVKCYAPSRTPEEGTRIFYSLIEALQKAPGARLVIKPHPYDYRDQYAQIIMDQGLHARVDLSMLDVHDLFPRASLVITEDSSAGLDAMFAGKPLIHAHFAESTPTMPFVDYGAALPGFTNDQLVESILRADDLDEVEAQVFLRGQIDFIRDFAGLCDGSSGKRFVDFVKEILCQK